MWFTHIYFVGLFKVLFAQSKLDIILLIIFNSFVDFKMSSIRPVYCIILKTLKYVAKMAPSEPSNSVSPSCVGVLSFLKCSSLYLFVAATKNSATTVRTLGDRRIQPTAAY